MPILSSPLLFSIMIAGVPRVGEIGTRRVDGRADTVRTRHGTAFDV